MMMMKNKSRKEIEKEYINAFSGMSKRAIVFAWNDDETDEERAQREIEERNDIIDSILDEEEPTFDLDGAIDNLWQEVLDEETIVERNAIIDEILGDE